MFRGYKGSQRRFSSVPEVIPLFPLGTVLFPGLVMPLNIFEPRYRRLVQDLRAAPEAEQRFGVVAIRQGREVGVDGVEALFDVGCAAQLRRTEQQEDGGYLIITVGAGRFRLTDLDPVSKPYLQGSVEWLFDADGNEPESAVLAVQGAFRTYLKALAVARDTEIEIPELPTDPKHLSYLVAATTVLDTSDKQALLAAPDTADRLRVELALLRREAALLTTLTAAPALDLIRRPQSPN